MKKFDLQLFADGNNNDLSARDYQLEFKELLQAVFGAQSYFGDFFGGGLEAMDGVQENEHAFYVKTSDIPVAVGTAYDTGANVAFGTGTGATSRFGKRTEIVYVNKPVDYSWQWLFHEGIDRWTVNNDFDVAIADRLELQARAKTAQFNAHHGAFISGAAGKIISAGADVGSLDVASVFNQLAAYFTNVGAVGTKVAKVTPDLYNAIIDSGLTTSSKGSTVNMDRNQAVMFKGFAIEEVPESLFQEHEVAYAYITGIGKAFTGINTTRTVESEDFDGVALQGAGKAGEYILPDNKKAVVKVTVGGDYGLDNLTVTSVAGTASGDTKITVSPALTSGNSYKYKVSDNAVLPAVDARVESWCVWEGSSVIAASTGKEIVIVECDANYLAKKGGIAVVTAKE